MRAFLFAFFFICAVCFSHAQSTRPIQSSNLIGHEIDFDPYRIDPVDTNRKINKNESLFKKLLNQQFSSLVTGDAKSSLGNFASVDITDPQVAFAGNFISKNGSVLTVKANGKISDGLLSVFSNSKLNTQIGLEVQYNFLTLSNRKLIYNADTADVYNNKLEKIKYDFETEFIVLKYRQELAKLLNKRISVQRQVDSLVVELAYLNLIDALPEEIYKTEFEWAKVMHLRDSVLAVIRDYPYFRTQFRNLHNQYLDKLDQLSLEPAVRGFTIAWFSMGYKVNNSKFKFFDPALTFTEQVRDTFFVSHQVSGQFSFYKWRPEPFRSLFIDAGVTFSYKDNFSSLTKSELSETSEFGASPGVRTSVNKYAVYSGKYKRNLEGLTLFGDIYYFLFKDNIAALHLNPEWVAGSGEKPVANIYTGFLFSFKKSKTENSVVNAELFYKFLDLFKTSETTYDLFERNNIGIRFVFPIQFKYKK